MQPKAIRKYLAKFTLAEIISFTGLINISITFLFSKQFFLFAKTLLNGELLVYKENEILPISEKLYEKVLLPVRREEKN